ncbi:MAG TPA: carboxypeptidase-like regulatory domain-containing protein [Cyclobacteriaceae bacterium]|nr:carboxypeptidase-like regulatory domain-containing protein [Cyclobacteriaceae bacterium]
MRLFYSLILILSTHFAFGQKFTINGYVKDSGNGEELIGVTVLVVGTGTGTVTNSYGFYSITLPPGKYDIQYSYVGYRNQVKSFDLTQNVSENIELISEATTIDEVVITGERLDANVTDIQMGHTKLNIAQIRKLPAMFGEVDIIKNVQLQPGVITAGEGTSSFFVRGGSADQNLILIDEAPIYDPSHLFGLFSVFNGDVVKDSELYRGGIPSRFGGRLSSILEVRTKDGNNKQFSGAGGIGSLASRLMLEGPIVKDKASYIVSARRSYQEIFAPLTNQNGQSNIVYFYDVNAKVNWKVKNNNRFFAAFYSGRDQFRFDRTFGFGWGNTTGTFRWNHLFSDRLFSNTTLIASNFNYKLELQDPVQGFAWTSKLQQYSLNNDLNYFINTNNELTFGYHLSYRVFQPGIISPNTDGSIFMTISQPKQYVFENNFYVDNKQKIGSKVTLSYGARLSIFQNIGPADITTYQDPQDNIQIIRTGTEHYDKFEPVKTYINLEPRFAATYLINPVSSVKASYNRMVQNTHLIASGTVPVPFNTWSPSGYYLKPQLADQYAIGYFRNFKENKYEVSVEAFYKNMQHVTDFADNAQLFFNPDLSVEFRQGSSYAKGLEFSGQKKEGKFTGFVSYTLSKVMRKVPGVNLGNEFPANHDRRNVVNMAVTYDLNERWQFGSIFTYSTGRPITLPSGRYEFGTYNVDLISERNGYRLPAYHRLDLSATWNKKPRHPEKRWRGQYVFSIYNVYNRHNPFTLYTRVAQDKDGNVIGDGTQKEARMIYLFPIFPSFTYNFKF